VISIAVADEEPMFRAGLAAYIEKTSGMAFKGEATDGREALSLVRREIPAILLLDFDLPRINGIGIIKAIKRDNLCSKCLVFTNACEASITQAINLGAMGVLQKKAGWPDIQAAIHGAFSGHPTLCQDALETIIKQMQHNADTEETLTPREREIMRLASQDLTIADMASDLYVAPSTVKSHLHNIYSKLGVRSEAGAVAAALRSGLID
jgi:two-component system nitrate/nitrite response regulator NarL